MKGDDELYIDEYGPSYSMKGFLTKEEAIKRIRQDADIPEEDFENCKIKYSYGLIVQAPFEGEWIPQMYTGLKYRFVKGSFPVTLLFFEE